MNRRHFLSALAAFGASPLVPSFITPAMAADTTGYKALVCLFLFGGNDSHNMVVPLTTAEYNTYSAARGGPAEANGLALPQGSLLPMPGGLFGMHPAMPNLAALCTQGKLAVVANTGPLLAPTTLAQYRARSVPLPPQLFSHSDMQSHWQTMRPDAPADSGWGGRLADTFGTAASGLLPVSVTLGGGGIFMKGDTSSAFQVGRMRYANGGIDNRNRIARVPRADVDWNWTGGNPQALFVGNTRLVRANRVEEQWANVMEGALDIGQFVNDGMYNATTVNGNTTYSLKVPVPGTWPTSGNGLAAQMHAVAAMIAARQALGVTRQVFFVSLGGFDNHGDQFGRDATTGNKTLLAGRHFDLLRQVDVALSAFHQATVALGVANSVTTMTMSDFGRTLKSNGQGCDHGWGGHQLVLGGGVNGGRIVGGFPTVALGTASDVGEGRLLPNISSDTYAATFAKWLGATEGELDAIFPNLARFPTRTLTDLML